MMGSRQWGDLGRVTNAPSFLPMPLPACAGMECGPCKVSVGNTGIVRHPDHGNSEAP